MFVYLSFFVICKSLKKVSMTVINRINHLLYSFILFNIGSSRYTPNGILINPSRYCFAFNPSSSGFPFISFNFAIAFSFTFSFAFNIYICCSSVILCISYFSFISFVYFTV